MVGEVAAGGEAEVISAVLGAVAVDVFDVEFSLDDVFLEVLGGALVGEFLGGDVVLPIFVVPLLVLGFVELLDGGLVRQLEFEVTGDWEGGLRLGVGLLVIDEFLVDLVAEFELFECLGVVEVVAGDFAVEVAVAVEAVGVHGVAGSLVLLGDEAVALEELDDILVLGDDGLELFESDTFLFLFGEIFEKLVFFFFGFLDAHF